MVLGALIGLVNTVTQQLAVQKGNTTFLDHFAARREILDTLCFELESMRQSLHKSSFPTWLGHLERTLVRIQENIETLQKSVTALDRIAFRGIYWIPQLYRDVWGLLDSIRLAQAATDLILSRLRQRATEKEDLRDTAIVLSQILQH